MAILDVKNQLVSHFLSKTTFSPADSVNIKVPDDLQDLRDALVNEAAQDLEKAEMVKGLKHMDGTITWVLTRPLGDFTQDVPVSAQVAELVSNVINGFIKANELDWPLADKMNLHEGNLMMLADIIHEMLEMNPNGGDDDDGE